jgi:signal transduction histidine kinase/ActR/RegA family two-component response regulator
VTAVAWLRPVLVACAGALVAAAAARTPPLARLDLWAGDRVQRFAAPPRTFDDTVIVDIDDASLARLQPVVGAWPYDRDLYARVVDYLTQAGARAIAIDILFADPRPGDAAFASALQRSAPAAIAAVATPFVVADRPHDRASLTTLGWRLDAATPARAWRDVTLPRPELTGRASVGIVTVMPDEDGMVRRVPMFNRIDGAIFPSLPLAARFAGAKPLAAVANGRLIVDAASWPVDENGEVQLLFGAAPYRITQVPFAKVAEAALDLHDDEATQRLFRDRTVFIGSTALLLGDVNETPMGRVPGVVFAAHAYLSLTHDLVLRPTSWPWTLLLVLVALAPAVAVRVFHADALLRLTAATSVGIALSWGAALALLVVQHQPASIVTAWLAGVTTFVLFLTEKIRALRETRQRLTSERLAAERTTRLKSEFLAHVSHELRTPLTAILGFSRVLADEPSLAADKRPLVQIIRRNGEQLLWLVNNLLDQARIAAGQMSIEPRPTSVRDVIDQVLSTLAGVPRRAGVELVSSCAAAVPSLVDVDGQRLQQIIINLAANALKFTERGRVYVGVDWERDWLRVEVDDTGPGMRREVLEQIFEAFHQGDESAVMRGGTGLGLTISRNLARLMGGDLTVESTVGRGSTFRLRIPAVVVERPATIVAPQAAPAAGVESATESPREAAVTATGAPRLRALIADDSEDIRALLQIFLRRIGMETIVAENGRRALEIALAERPDIVLMDVQMPEMGGVEAVQAMRRAGFTNSVVALTAGSGDDVAHELEAAGFSAVVFKPVTGDELTDAVVRLLGLESNAVARGGSSTR